MIYHPGRGQGWGLTLCDSAVTHAFQSKEKKKEKKKENKKPPVFLLTLLKPSKGGLPHPKRAFLLHVSTWHASEHKHGAT